MYGYVAQSPQVLYVVKAPKQSSCTPESVYGAPTDPSDHNLCPSNGIVCKYREKKYSEKENKRERTPSHRQPIIKKVNWLYKYFKI